MTRGRAVSGGQSIGLAPDFCLRNHAVTAGCPRCTSCTGPGRVGQAWRAVCLFQRAPDVRGVVVIFAGRIERPIGHRKRRSSVKILYLVPQPKRPDRIGAYTFLDEEIQALAAAGITAYVLATAAPSDAWCGKVGLLSFDRRAAAAGPVAITAFGATQVGRIPWQNLLNPVQAFRTARIEYVASQMIRELDVDLVHSHFAWPQGSGGALARAASGRPLVASLRGTDILVDRSIDYGRRVQAGFDRALRRLLATADCTVYFSNYMREQGVALGARPERTRVIRKGVDLSQFGVAADRRALRAELGLEDRPMLLTVAGLIPRKGIHHILASLSRLRDTHDFTFVVCGDGPERARLEALSQELGLRSRTRFLGQVDRQTIPKYFAACDMFLLASIMEAAGNVLFESMASGRPVVCTDSGGPGEYVCDGETGYVVPVGDPDAMAARVRELLDDPARCEALGREAHRRTVGEFDYDCMVADLIAVYDETLTRAPERHAQAS